MSVRKLQRIKERARRHSIVRWNAITDNGNSRPLTYREWASMASGTPRDDRPEEVKRREVLSRT